MKMNQQLYLKRRITSLLGLAFSMTAMAIGLAVLLWILYVLFSNGLSALDGHLLTSDSLPPVQKAVACATRLWGV